MKILCRNTWQPIPNYEGIYQYNGLGQVKSLPRDTQNEFKFTERILKPVLNQGYYRYSLYKNHKLWTIKRSHLVWLYFNNRLPERGFVIDHIDGNKTNDNINNLQILRHRKNVSKGFIQNGRKHNLPTGVYPSKDKFRAQYWDGEKRTHLGTFKTAEEAHLSYLEAIK